MKSPQPNTIPGANAVRAVACLWVLGCHLSSHCPEPLSRLPLLESGGMGVAMFFVLSGFLLALPFLEARNAGRAIPDLRLYALRRLARIAPEFYVCVLATATAGGAWATPWGRRQIAACLTFTSSFLPPTFTPWFDAPLWSIGVEMVFYALLACAMLLAFGYRLRLAGRAALAAGLLAGIAAGQFALLHAAPALERAIGNASLFHATSSSTVKNAGVLFAHFLIGVLAADVHLRLPMPPRPPLGPAAPDKFDAVALAAVAAAILGLFHGDHLAGLAWMHYDWPTFPVLVGVVLVATPRSALLSRRADPAFIRVTAAWSYGIYIWHFPILTALCLAWPATEAHALPRSLAIGFATLAASYAVAGLSHQWIGKPAVAHARRLEAWIHPAAASAPGKSFNDLKAVTAPNHTQPAGG